MSLLTYFEVVRGADDHLSGSERPRRIVSKTNGSLVDHDVIDTTSTLNSLLYQYRSRKGGIKFIILSYAERFTFYTKVADVVEQGLASQPDKPLTYKVCARRIGGEYDIVVEKCDERRIMSSAYNRMQAKKATLPLPEIDLTYVLACPSQTIGEGRVAVDLTTLRTLACRKKYPKSGHG
jgi:hypothetical protein